MKSALALIFMIYLIVALLILALAILALGGPISTTSSSTKTAPSSPPVPANWTMMQLS
ncbi:MAG: hypothetical protein AB7O86_05855 [Porticoccaceae bacterium]